MFTARKRGGTRESAPECEPARSGQSAWTPAAPARATSWRFATPECSSRISFSSRWRSRSAASSSARTRRTTAGSARATPIRGGSSGTSYCGRRDRHRRCRAARRSPALSGTIPEPDPARRCELIVAGAEWVRVQADPSLGPTMTRSRPTSVDHPRETVGPRRYRRPGVRDCHTPLFVRTFSPGTSTGLLKDICQNGLGQSAVFTDYVLMFRAQVRKLTPSAMRIFVSSTLEDLVEYRKKATDAVERLGQQGIRMEVFGARPAQATEACFEEIDSSDAFVGIYAHRYGFVPKLSSTSITEQEFNFALGKKKPIFCFIVDEGYPWLPRFIDQEPNQLRLRAFKHKLEETIIRDSFTTADDLAYKVASSVGRFLISRRVKDELDKLPGRDSVSSPEGRDQIARRAARLGQLMAGARILLVNDVPSEMSHVVALLQGLNLHVDIVKSSDAALSKPGRSPTRSSSL